MLENSVILERLMLRRPILIHNQIPSLNPLMLSSLDGVQSECNARQLDVV